MQAIEFVGPNHALQILGVKLVGVTSENLKKLLFSGILLLVLYGLGWLLRWIVPKVLPTRDSVRVAFWSRQAIQLATAILTIVGLLSIWFDDPTRLTTA